MIISRIRNSGFTLLELLVVVSIISVMLAIAAPRMAGRSQAVILRGVGYDLQTLATTARARAIISGQTVGLLLSTEGELRLISKQPDGLVDLVPRRRLPEGISVRFQPAGDSDSELIRFRPDGSADGGELLLNTRRGGELRLHLSEPLGRLRLSQTS